MRGSVVKPVRWIASSRDDVRDFPSAVRLRVGGALWEAQKGGKAPWAKPLRGYGGSGLVEIIDDHDGDTYRAVYTVRFEGVVCTPRLPEEIEERHRHTKEGPGADRRAT